MNCEEIVQQYIETIGSGFGCTKHKEYVKIVTPYYYPDKDLIEIYVQKHQFGQYIITDLGETLRHLYSQGYDVYGTSKRKYLLKVVLANSDVEFQEGKLFRKVKEDEIGEAIFDVISASMAIGDFIFSSRTYEPATFIEVVENFLNESDIEYKKNYQMKGQSGHNYKADFRIFNHQPILLDALSPVSDKGIKNKVSNTLRKWLDVNGQAKKISLLNDMDFEWSEPDINLLSTVSTVITWSEKKKIIEIAKSNL